MNHLVLLVICFLSVELFIRSNCISLIISIIKVSKKAIYVISNKNISDHWKEKITLQYSLQIMNSSLEMLLIFSFLLLLIIISDVFFSGFIGLTLSLNGIIESILFTFTLAYLRKMFVR